MRALVAASLLSLAALLLASAAFAEGSWSSSMTNVLTGFESRQWTDNNSDAANTVITFGGCTSTPPPNSSPNTSVNLRRIISFWPDEDRGNDTLFCGGSDSGNWGRVPGGDYKFRIDQINGQTSGQQLSASTVHVAY